MGREGQPFGVARKVHPNVLETASRLRIPLYEGSSTGSKSALTLMNPFCPKEVLWGGRK